MIANRYRVVGLLGIGVGRGGGVVGVSMMLLVALVLLRLLVRDSRVAVGSRINTMNPAEWAGTSSVISLVALLIVAAIAATIASGGRGWLQDEV